MKQQKIRVVSLFLVLSIFLISDPALLMPKAKAQFWLLSNVTPQLVIDPTVAAAVAAAGAAQTTATTAGFLEEAWRFIQDKVFKVLLATLKKQLLDEITRETVQWIQNGDKPLFLQKPGKVFEQAADEAAGEVIRQVGAGQLCSGIPFNVNFYLAQPDTTKKQVSCTLSQVVSNLESFKRDFKTGGWLGYSDLLKPQNNQYGLEILTQQALEQSVAQKQQESVLKQNINLGFNSEACITWTMYSVKTSQPANNKGSGGNILTPGFQFGASTYAGSLPLVVKTDGSAPQPTSDDPNFEYRCTEKKTTTPGRTIAEGLNKSFGSNIDFIVNSDDITNVLAAVLDAAFNRLVKEGINGVKTGLAKLSPDNTQNSGITRTPDITNAASSSDTAQKNMTNSQIAAIFRPLDDAQTALNDASNVLLTAASSTRNLYITTKSLLSCLGSNASSTDISWASSTLVLATSTYPGQIKTIQDSLNNQADSIQKLQDRASLLKNQASSGQMPSIDQSFRDLITAALSSASSIKSDATQLLAAIQLTLKDAQGKLNACVGGSQVYP